MPYPYSVGSGLNMLRPRQRPGPYLQASSGRIYGVFRSPSSREIIVRYSTDAGATWTEADSGNRPLQSASTDGQEGALQHASCACRVANKIRIVYAANGGTTLAVVNFDMDAGSFGLYETPITGGPSTSHGWDCVSLDNGDLEIFFNLLNGNNAYQIKRVTLASGGTWGSVTNVTDPATEDEIQTPALGLPDMSTNVASVVKFSSGDLMLFYVVNNNNHSHSSSPFYRARRISGATVGDPSRGRPPAAYATGVDTEAYFNGSAEVLSCGDVEVAICPVMVATQITNLANNNTDGVYLDPGILSVYEADPRGLRLEMPTGILLSQRDIGPSWHQVPCLLWDGAAHALRYYVERCYENEHPSREGDADLVVATSRFGAWDAEAVVFAANGVEKAPPGSAYWLNTFGLLAAGFVAGGDVGIFMQCSQGTTTTDHYEDPHYYQYTPTAASAASPCGAGGGGATTFRVNAY